MVDINVWLALTWEGHPQHTPAAHWHKSADDATLLFCRFTMLGFLRLLTNRQVMGGSTVTVSGALDLYDRWRSDPRVELTPEPRATEECLRRALRRHADEPATKVVADCYLVAVAESISAHLITFDKGLAGTARSQDVPVVLLKPAGGK